MAASFQSLTAIADFTSLMVRLVNRCTIACWAAPGVEQDPGHLVVYEPRRGGDLSAFDAIFFECDPLVELFEYFNSRAGGEVQFVQDVPVGDDTIDFCAEAPIGQVLSSVYQT